MNGSISTVVGSYNGDPRLFFSKEILSIGMSYLAMIK